MIIRDSCNAPDSCLAMPYGELDITKNIVEFDQEVDGSLTDLQLTRLLINKKGILSKTVTLTALPLN